MGRKNLCIRITWLWLCAFSNSNNKVFQHWKGIIDPRGLSVMWSLRGWKGMHFLGASRLQTEQGLEVKGYPEQTCMWEGRLQGDPLSKPPITGGLAPQKSNPITDSMITCRLPQQRCLFRWCISPECAGGNEPKWGRKCVCAVYYSFSVELVYSGVQQGCIMFAAAVSHPDFLTVFWDLMCHPCQQSPGDLLANDDTVGAPVARSWGVYHIPYCSAPPYPRLIPLQGPTILFLRCAHIFFPLFYFFNFSCCCRFFSISFGGNPGITQFSFFFSALQPWFMVAGGLQGWAVMIYCHRGYSYLLLYGWAVAVPSHTQSQSYLHSSSDTSGGVLVITISFCMIVHRPTVLVQNEIYREYWGWQMAWWSTIIPQKQGPVWGLNSMGSLQVLL